MEFVYEKNDRQASVIYGETVASLVKKEQFEEKHVLFVTNQKYYDRYSDKLIQLFNERQNLDWYICSNDPHCNNFSELESLLAFFEKFPATQEYLLIGVGNEGVMSLTAFLEEGSLLTTQNWQLPLSLQALSRSLSGKGAIELHHRTALAVPSLPSRIIYDQTMIKKDGDSQLADFMIFIQCGVVCSHDFLRNLYKNFGDRQRLNQQPFNGLLHAMLQFYQEDGGDIQRFGTLFELAFYRVEGGHLLSGYMKQLLGMLLQLLWSQQKSGFSFHYQNFLVWLIRLGYPVEFPQQILVSDYVQELLSCCEELGPCLLLKDIGTPAERVCFDAEELLQTVEEYKRFIIKIEEG